MGRLKESTRAWVIAAGIIGIVEFLPDSGREPLIVGRCLAADGEQPAASKASKTGAASVETRSSKTIPLGPQGRWKKVPDCLEGASIHTQPLEKAANLQDFKCTVKTGGVVVVAAERVVRPGRNSSAVRQQERDTEQKLEAQGWLTIGKIRESESGGDELTAFRKIVKAGDKLEFPTGIYGMPFLVMLTDKQAEQVLSYKEALVPLHELKHLKPRQPPAGLSAKSAQDVVMLTANELDPSTRGPGLIERELARQAFLLAARDELGLATRDMALREPFPHDENGVYLPFEMLVTVNENLAARITILRQNGDQYEVLWQKELNLVAAGGLIEDLVAQCERLSRTEFVEFLKRSGLKPKPRPTAAAGAAHTELDAAPGDFNFLAQFGALRRRHAELAAHPESPGVLAALARKYAEIGAETAFLWSPAHKAFEARALLYAERLVRQTSASPQALWTRAYVRAFVGRHRAALDDLAQAAKSSPANAKAPAWAEVIGAHCEFDQTKLNAAAANEKLRPLVRYLQMLEQEFGSGKHATLRIVGDVLDASPDSFRAMDLLAENASLGIARTTRAQMLVQLPRSLSGRLSEVPGIPTQAAYLYRDDNENDGDELRHSEMKRRVRLLEVLNQAARKSIERAEPSLGVLASLIHEAGFVHAWRMAAFDRYWLGVPADETIDALTPLIEMHPYRAYVESLRNDAVSAAASLKELAKSIDTSELELTELPLLNSLGRTGRGPLEAWFKDLAMFRYDLVYRDLARRVLFWNNDYTESQQADLKYASPRAPAVVVTEIKLALATNVHERALEHAAEWERAYRDDATVLAALAEMYLKIGRDDDALRIAKREVEITPDLMPCLRLARLYKKQGDLEHWKSTLDAFLEQESFGLEHSDVQIEIANHYMGIDDYNSALPYALKAAGTWSFRGLMIASRCYEGMHDWENAELYVQRCAERYENTSYKWFFWCKRTGQGHMEAARRMAEAHFEALGPRPSPGDQFLIAALQQLTGDREAALGTSSAAFKASNDPRPGLFAALIAHELNKTEERDALFEQIASRGKSFVVNGRGRPQMISVAAMIREHIGAGKEGPFDEERFAKLSKDAVEGEPTNLEYLVGRYLVAQGHTDQGHKHLLRAATSPIDAATQTLAAAELRAANVEVGEMRATE
jgi:tetratricopeptide (TPR) repeat protein